MTVDSDDRRIPDVTDEVAGRVLREQWRIEEPITRVDLGVNRANWRVGDAFWLTACEAGRAAQFRREGELLERLTRILHADRSSFRVPTPVPAETADLSVRSEGYEWRMTVRVDGRPADAASEALYDPYVRVLAELHRALRRIPVDEAPLRADAIEHGESLVAKREDPNWRPATDDASEPLVVKEIGCWLGGRFERLSQLPAQLVHGDWTPANVLLAEGEAPRVVAVLDFEHCRPAPVELDLAQLFSTLLMWSGYERERVARMMRRSLGVYEEASGRAVDVLDVHACMAVYWLANYWMGRDLAERTGRYEDALRRQPSRLRTVLAFVQSAVS